MPNIQEAADDITDSCAMTQDIKTGAGWTRKGKTSAKDSVSLSIATPEVEPKKLNANLDTVTGADDSRINTVICNPGDKNNSPRASLCAGATEIIC